MNLIRMLLEYYSANPVLFILLTALAICVIVQLIYFWAVFARAAFFKPANEYTRRDEPVSIVICARDEYHNLKQNLPLLLSQDYERYEVVVVNHASVDETRFLLQEMQAQYSHLKVVHLEEDLNFFTGKKFPLSIGIKSATYEVLLFTDADCVPRSDQWLRRMASNFTEKTAIVLGYGAYKHDKGLLNRLIRFDTVRIALQYFGFALSSMPYMGVGRNMAYRKSLFYHHNGFISHYRIQSGDDDLFVNRAARSKNTRVEMRPESHTVSIPKNTFNQWFRQKKRHLQSGRHYRSSHKIMLGIFGVSQFLFFVLFILLLSMQYLVYVVLALAAARFLTQLFVYKRFMKKLSEKGFLLLVPFFEVSLMIITFFAVVSNQTGKQGKWR